MQITNVKLLILENPDLPTQWPWSGEWKIVRAEGLRRNQFTHTSIPTDEPVRQSFIKVETDEGIDGICTTYMTPREMFVLRNQVIGEDPLHREWLYQKLHKGTRWVYQRPGWFGDFDNCLWDIAGKAANLPIHALIGRVRDRLPVYLTGLYGTVDDYLGHIESGREWGINAYKFHSHKGGKADIPILKDVREAVGPEYVLLHDPVCAYTLREAIEVGHVMEELDFVWLEEPMHEHKINEYQELCRELTIPVMATEMLMNDIGLCSQWLIAGATDRIRANARNGTTQVLKMAHFTELYGTNVEMNSDGGLFGLLHAHLGCCIDNTEFYEAFGDLRIEGRGGVNDLQAQGKAWGLLNAPLFEDGHIAPPNGPGWGAEWDDNKFQSLIVREC